MNSRNRGAGIGRVNGGLNEYSGLRSCTQANRDIDLVSWLSWARAGIDMAGYTSEVDVLGAWRVIDVVWEVFFRVRPNFTTLGGFPPENVERLEELIENILV